MIHLLANDTPLSVLGSLVEPVLVYDATGARVIGQYTPVDVERGQRLYAEHASRVDAAEVARRKAAAGQGRPLSEVLNALPGSAAAPTTGGSLPVELGDPTGRGECATP